MLISWIVDDLIEKLKNIFYYVNSTALVMLHPRYEPRPVFVNFISDNWRISSVVLVVQCYRRPTNEYLNVLKLDDSS